MDISVPICRGLVHYDSSSGSKGIQCRSNLDSSLIGKILFHLPSLALPNRHQVDTVKEDL